MGDRKAPDSQDMQSPRLPNQPPATTGNGWSTWVQYIYFLRFPLLLWAAFPLLSLLDWFATTSATRVLFTLNSRWQMLYLTFQVMIAGWQALTAARIVCAYGADRFSTKPPVALDLSHKSMGWRVFWCAQIPGLLGLAYVAWRSWNEMGGYKEITIGLALGGCFAFVFWYLLALLYAYLHESSTNINVFLLPHAPPPSTPRRFAPLSNLLEDATEAKSPGWSAILDSLFRWIARHGGRGYMDEAGNLCSGQIFAILLFLGLVGLHIALAFVTYPLPRTLGFYFRHRLQRMLGPFGPFLGVSSIILFLVFIFLSLYLAVRLRQSEPRPRFAWVSPVAALLSAVCLACWIVVAREPKFPALATIVVLLTFFLWTVSGMAFAFDRFRIPTLAALTACIFFVHSFSTADHVYEPKGAASTSAVVPTATEVLAKRPQAAGREPLIVVTATGGGIHSAYWTATVLRNLEESFSKQHRPLHKSLLLISSVSGGSVAAADWIREYASTGCFAAAVSDSNPCLSRLTDAAQRSSVEAAAWGLLHYDLYQFLFPHGPLRILSKDRGWFLQQSLLLNRFMAEHENEYPQVADVPPNWESLENDPTLGGLADPLGQGGMPAFALNTTAVETGERFLLANYQPARTSAATTSEPEQVSDLPCFASAPSFLTHYAADIPLATAARLSATFPYVSPVSRGDFSGSDPGTFHFADGGYYDNDGVATAEEFLWLAMSPKGVCRSDTSLPQGSSVSKILLIQIRDSSLPGSPTAPVEGQGKSCGVLCQIFAPLATFYHAGHVADSQRDQRQLSVLGSAIAAQADVKTVVFDYATPGGKNLCTNEAPLPNSTQRLQEIQKQMQNWTTLNWLLSKEDRDLIVERWAEMQPCADSAAQWFTNQFARSE